MKTRIKKWIETEKFHLSVILGTSIILFISSYCVENYSSEHKDLAIYMPYMAVLVGIGLFSIQLLASREKLQKWKLLRDSHTTGNGIVYTKLLLIISSAPIFLFADLVVVYSICIGYFAFGFNAATTSFPQAWNQFHVGEIMFPVLALISLWNQKINQ